MEKSRKVNFKAIKEGRCKVLQASVPSCPLKIRTSIWCCHDPRFVFEGTEDMADEYHNYRFHVKGSLIGEGIALVICAVVGLIIQFVL